MSYTDYTALLWQKEASDKIEISCKRANCVRHFHWRQWNIMMSYLTYLWAGWVFMHKIWHGKRAHWVKYKNINNLDLDGMLLAPFCQSRAVQSRFCFISSGRVELLISFVMQLRRLLYFHIANSRRPVFSRIFDRTVKKTRSVTHNPPAHFFLVCMIRCQIELHVFSCD